MQECWPIDSKTLKEAYIAFISHDFLTSSFKYFAAAIAIVIAWQRSIVSDLQLKSQNSSNNISNYFNIQDHVTKNVDESIEKISPNNLILQNKTLLFYSIFMNPSSGNFNPSHDFESHIHQLYSIIERLASSSIALNQISSPSSEIHLGNKSASGRANTFNIYLSGRKLTDDKFYQQRIDLLEKIDIDRNTLAHASSLFLASIGITFSDEFKTQSIDPFHMSQLIMKVITYLNEVILHPPISPYSKYIFDKHFHKLENAIFKFEEVIKRAINDLVIL